MTALHHYTGLAVSALENKVRELSAELAEWRGTHVRPQRGCRITSMILGDGEALVEYEYAEPAPDRCDPDAGNPGPGHQAEVNIIGVYINKMWLDAQEVIAPAVIERWQEVIAETEAEAAEWREEA